VIGGQKELAMPHVSVPDIRWVDWKGLKAAGFRACVFDKDNTITDPYALTIKPELQESMAECLEVFGRDQVSLLSNSAGLFQFDPDGKEAEIMEEALGIRVLRHREKKPGGSSHEISQQLGCRDDEMIMIGDRVLTDVVYGNRNGMFTIRVEPLTDQGEKKSVKLARALEEYLLHRWQNKGRKAPVHRLAPTEEDCLNKIKRPGCW